jgi:tetratricopeptide (TPR) repeat protein
MTCRIFTLGTVLVLLTASAVHAQSSASEAALAAEGAGQWDEAVRLYRTALDTDSHRADLWVRVADIEARNGHLAECIEALQRAVGAAPPTASLYFRLSQAYSMAGQPAAALAAVERAWVLAPTSVEYLRARATLATWLGDYARAGESYRLLVMSQPHDVDMALSFARVSAWGGDTNEAVTQYERYLKAHADVPEVWLELAKAESWRGNYGSATRALSEYRSRFGETLAYSQALAAVMTSSGRPGRAEDVVAPLLAQSPDNYELNVTHTIALAMQHRVREAFSSLETVRHLAPESRATHDAERVLRSMLASTFEPQFTVYTDSDKLTVQRFAPRGTVALRSGTTVSAGYERARLDARAGSGLEQVDGSQTADYRHGWMAASQMIGSVKLSLQGGYATAETHDIVSYSAGAEVRATDSLWFGVNRTSGAVVISPRTVGMGLTQIAHRVQLNWAPTLQSMVAVDGSYQELSDGNHRLELTISPRRSFARRAGFNLDLGVSAYRLETAEDLANGYYDPHRYEYYAFTASPYFKVSENVGLSLSTAVGAQRDSTSPSFHLGGTATADATFGIYRAWALKVTGSALMNQRLASGAYQGVSGSVVLVRRF